MSRLIHEAWHMRYAVLIWAVALRYIAIGVEFLLGVYGGTITIDGLPKELVGCWMMATGFTGVAAMMSARKDHCLSHRLTEMFCLGVAIRAAFGISLMVQHGAFSSPLLILFACDFTAMSWILYRLFHSRRCITYL